METGYRIFFVDWCSTIEEGSDAVHVESRACVVHDGHVVVVDQLDIWTQLLLKQHQQRFIKKHSEINDKWMRLHAWC